ncbi:MAG: imidazoleglycerol-phosphate dehydratase HisB [SAR202 cluster bacterium]|nr:imidazoleglycerol-phosphate dehydratase HisB [SAR202 cluster bacterium]|tara:strand:+ start:782 stop:1387 length:606 start_codon:yes stop_codon:yes gene_type:complete
MSKSQRIAQKKRKTNETDINVKINLDGTGEYNVKTGNGMLDHLLAQIARHGLMDLDIQASGDIEVGYHHLVEDIAITLGQTINEALSDGQGITRMGHTYVPLDEALVLTVVDCGGRGYACVESPLTDSDLGGLPSDLIRHFMEAFAIEAKINLHLKVVSGINNHHIAEASFKSLARSLKTAVSFDPRVGDSISSTKGTINA